jgi:hypothetical protein
MRRNRIISVTLVAAVAVVALALAGCAGAAKAGDTGAAPMKVGIRAQAAEASLKVDDQPGAADSLKVAAVKAPEAAWLAVHLDDGGKPGKRIGIVSIPKGESTGVDVPLDRTQTLTDKVIVAVHADRANAGKFDFDMERFDASPDKPFWVDGQELAVFVKVK